jgi:hypothetical protein
MSIAPISLLLLPIAISACLPAVANMSDPPTPANLPLPCGKPVSPVDGARVAGPAFSLVLPPGFQPVEVQGIDSQVGQWSNGAGQVIAYDYGASINNDGLRGRLVNYAECRDSIGGLPVLIATGVDTAGTMFSTKREPQYVAVASWREFPPGPHMSVGVTSKDAAGLRRGLSVIRSVRFE